MAPAQTELHAPWTLVVRAGSVLWISRAKTRKQLARAALKMTTASPHCALWILLARKNWHSIKLVLKMMTARAETVNNLAGLNAQRARDILLGI